MIESTSNLFKSFSDELDPEKLQRKFLSALLQLQNVERGSIWIKRDGGYLCVEAVGTKSESIKGVNISAQQKSIVGWVIENGKMTIADPVEDDRHYKEVEEKIDVKSSLILCFPLFLRDKEVYGAVQIIDTTQDKNQLNLEGKYLSHIQDLVNIGSVSLSNAILYSKQLEETQNLKDVLEEIRSESVMVGHNHVFENCLELVRSYANTDFPVLISGESGTGKELVSRRIHQLSPRKDKPFFIQNCSAIPETLLESELFGYKKGAFSGAEKDKVGLFEAADGGTVFLDEIGDMAVNLQARILRVIQNREVKPLGETKVKYVDIRIISASNRDIKKMVADNEFRQDLFYRLSVLPLQLPPLRERLDDIPLLLSHFLKREALKLDVSVKKINSEAMQTLITYHWPGNIRELENLVRYLLVVTNEEHIKLGDLPVHFKPGQQEISNQITDTSHENVSSPNVSGNPQDLELNFGNRTWETVEKDYVHYLLKKYNWNVTWASRDSGVNRSTFASRMKRLGIRR
jgi:transcriptional regulator with GAF, ATPase, and Fis domain